MPLEMSSKFLEGTVNGLREQQSICIRVSAVKAINEFCVASIAGNNTIKSILYSHLPIIFQGVYTLTTEPSNEVLILVMQTLEVLISVIVFIISSGYSFVTFQFMMNLFFFNSWIKHLRLRLKIKSLH